MAIKYQNLVLDFSGTIADDRAKVYRTMNDVLKSYNLKKIDFATWRQVMSLDFRKMWADLGVEADLEEVVARYREFYPHNPGPFTIPGNREALEKLSKILGKNNISVLSGCPQEELEAHLLQLGLEKWIGRTLGGKFEKKEELSLYSPESTLYVGDMEQDILAANDLGIDFAAMDNEYAYHNIGRLAGHKPKYTIKHLRGLIPIVQNGR